MVTENSKTDEKIAVKNLDLRVMGVLEKRWGQLMCGHGYEGMVSFFKLPDFPQT